MQTYKYRLYPSSNQRRKLQCVLDACLWVYNKTLEVRKTAWEERQESLSLYDTQRMIPEWKAEHDWLAVQAHSQVLQNACVRVDLAFSAFFRRVKAGAAGAVEKVGYPRFRGFHRYDSFTFPQSGFWLPDTGTGHPALGNGRVRLSKIGDVKIKLHRPICGEIKTLTVRRDGLGNWWATFACEYEPEHLPQSNLMVGVDVGLRHFLTTDQGRHVDNPRYFRKEEQALAKAQRRLSQYKIGSPEWHKQKRVVQHIHKRIANKRHNFIHQFSRAFVNKYQIIALVKLDIQYMQAGNWFGLNKSIGDAAWGMFAHATSYKAEYAGRSFVQVNPHGTTQRCSGCDRIVKKDLSVRIHSCNHCGLVLDRDENAARNILSRGLATLGPQLHRGIILGSPQL